MTRFSFVLLMIISLLCPASAGRCQGMMGMTRGMTVYTLLMTKEVQKELKLKPDQVKQVMQKQKEATNIKANDPAAMAAAMATMSSTDAVEKSFADVFTPEQAKRLHELVLQ
jgi:hypothetical protein